MSSETSTAGALAGQPLLAGLPADLRELVERSFVTRRLEFGEALFETGDIADAYYVIAEGSARVLIVGDDGAEVSLNVLGPGEAFGEAALLEGTPRTATVRALTPLTVLRLDAGVFRALAEMFPAIGETFQVAERARRINDFLRVHSGFAALGTDATLELVEHLEELEAHDGQVVVAEGDPSDAMYLVHDGRLGVWRRTEDGSEDRLRTLHSGEFFGELGLLRGAPRSATVRAEGPARLLRLAAEDFRRFVDSYPPFEARVRERLALYEARDRTDMPAPAEPAPTDAWTAEDPGLAVTDHGEEAPAQEAAPAIPRRFPFVRQIDAMDCGAACVAMVCRGFGHDVSITSIRHAVGTSADGTTLRGLVRGGDEIGLRMRPIKSSPDRLDTLPLPAIVHYKGNHWVVLYRVDGDRVRIADPGVGLRGLPRAEFDRDWSGYAALAAPTERLAQAPRGGLDLRWLRPFVAPHRGKIALAALLALVAAGLEMLLPVFSGIIIDQVVGKHREGLLAVVAAVMFAVIVLAVVVTVGERLILARVASQLDVETLDFLSLRLLRLPMRYFETRRTGDIERRISGMRQVRAVLIQNGVAALTAGTQLVVAVIIMFVYSWPLGLLFCACAPLYIGLMRYSQTRLRPVFDGVEEGTGRYQSQQIDAIRGIETVKVMGAEDGLRQRMSHEFGELRDKLYRADIVAMSYEGLISIVSFVVYGLFLVVAALFALNGDLTVGGLVAVSGLVLLANTPIAVLLALWDRLQLVTVLLGRLQDVFEQEPEQGADHSRLKPVGDLEGHIRLRRVGFAYASSPDRPVLQDVSLDVPPGTTVALVGRSGSGKSTLAKCLAGLLVPTEGAIEFDGQDLRGLRFGDLRRRIGFVLQEPYLFDDTIEANIAFGEPRPDAERVRWAAEIADAAEFIEGLPLRYRTRVGDSGMRLSGGQAQRVAIARSLYHQPPVLIFDEATSALDTEAERAVKQNMDRLLQGRTAFVIAHRLSTIRDADIICVLEQGRLVEHGTNEDLLRRQGLYAYLQGQQLDA